MDLEDQDRFDVLIDAVRKSRNEADGPYDVLYVGAKPDSAYGDSRIQVLMGGSAAPLLDPDDISSLPDPSDQAFPDAESIVESCGGTSVLDYAPRMGIGLPRTITWETCSEAIGDVDHDRDGLSDSCEYGLAHAFRPMLNTQVSDTLNGKEPYWAARLGGLDTEIPEQQRSSTTEVTIIYLLSYYDDSQHRGDSEYIAISVTPVAGSVWVVSGLELSSHTGAIGDEHLKAVWERGLADVKGFTSWVGGRVGGRVQSWVAAGKPANHESLEAYRTHENRFDGLMGFLPVELLAESVARVLDDCGGEVREEDVEVRPEWNIGAFPPAGRPLQDCVGSRIPESMRAGTECFWTDEFFDGWNLESDGTAGYKKHLARLHFRQGDG